MKVMIVGTGAGALALAVDLLHRQLCREVVMVDIPEFGGRIVTMSERDDAVTSTGFISGQFEIQASLDWSVAASCECIMVATVADAHPEVATLLAPHLNSGQTVVYFPGNLGGELLKLALPEGIEPFIIEGSTLPYGCRSLGVGRVHISLLSPRMLLGGAEYLHETNPVAFGLLHRLLPTAKPSSLYSAFLSNPNPLYHTTPCLCSAARIDEGDPHFRMYEHGVTPAVLRLLEAKDHERMAIAAAIGATPLAWSEMESVLPNGTRRQFLECGKLAAFAGPNTLRHRYITEDAKMLACWERLGQLHTIPTPIISGEITLLSHLTTLDFRALAAPWFPTLLL